MNPVQFKITSTEEKPMTNVKGMTVFNTNDVNTKKTIPTAPQINT